MRSKLFCQLVLALMGSTAALAQVPISASHVADAFLRPITSAKLCFAPVDAAAKPAGFRVGSVQVLPGQVCGLVSNGVLQSGLGVAPSASGVYYHIWAANRATGAVLRDYGMTPIIGSTWTLDTFDPITMGVLPQAVTMGAVTTLSPGSSAGCTISGVSPYYLNCGIPKGDTGLTGPQGNPGINGDANGLADPGGNGIVYRTGPNTTRIAISGSDYEPNGSVAAEGYRANLAESKLQLDMHATVTGSGSSQVTTIPGTVAAMATNGVYDYCSFTGMHCDGATDDTSAFNALLQTINTNGGGTITGTPRKTSLILGQILVPQTLVTPPGWSATQMIAPTRLVGGGNNQNGYGPNVLGQGFTLDLRFNAPVAKILTTGYGVLEISGTNLFDGGSDCATFLQTTSTTVKLHNNTFQGTASGAVACNDAIVLGGSDPATRGTPTSAFGGYGTVIRENYFSSIKHAVRVQNFGNSSDVSSNFVQATSGNPTGGAFTLQRTYVGGADNEMYANSFSNNYIETVYYMYGIEMRDGAKYNALINNNCQDGGAPYLSCVLMDTGGTVGVTGNTVIGSTAGPKTYLTTTNGIGWNFVLDPSAGYMNAPGFITPGNVTATGIVTASYLNATGTQGYQLKGVNSITSDGSNMYLSPQATGSSIFLNNFAGTKNIQFKDNGDLLPGANVYAVGVVQGTNVIATANSGYKIGSGTILNGDGTNLYVNPQAGGGSVYLSAPVVISAESSHSGQATCFKASGVIGYCSTVVSASGSCTCN